MFLIGLGFGNKRAPSSFLDHCPLPLPCPLPCEHSACWVLWKSTKVSLALSCHFTSCFCLETDLTTQPRTSHRLGPQVCTAPFKNLPFFLRPRLDGCSFYVNLMEGVRQDPCKSPRHSSRPRPPGRHRLASTCLMFTCFMLCSSHTLCVL